MYHIIVNPASKSGKGKKIWKVIEPVLLEKEVPYEVYFTKRPGDIAYATRRLSRLHTKIDLILLGGDGTVNEALQGMDPISNFTVGYIPTGSSNDLARDLGLPTNPVNALNRILERKNIFSMDIGFVQSNYSSHYFLVSCGIGFDAAVCAEAISSPIKDTLNHLGLGKLTYLGIALKQLIQAPKVPCDFWLDDSEKPVHLDQCFFIATMNHRYEGGGFKFCPNADCQDEIFNLCCVGNISKFLILLALPTAFWGKHYFARGVDEYCAGKVHIKTGKPLWVHTDGEVSKPLDEITISFAKEKMKFIY